MEPITFALGGTTMTLLGIVGRVMYLYGRDRKELNGTVDRVKRIDSKLDKHIEDELQVYSQLTHDVTEIKTKVDLLVRNKIKE